MTYVGADVIIVSRFKRQIEIPAADREQALPEHVWLNFIEKYFGSPSLWFCLDRSLTLPQYLCADLYAF